MSKLSRTFFGFVALVWASFPAQAVTLDNSLRGTVEALPALAGEKMHAGSLRGHVVLVNFFASWCPPCHKEFRHLNELHRDYAGRGLKIVSVNYLENFGGFKDKGGRLARFLARYDPKFSVVRGGDPLALKFDDVRRIPTVFIFDRSGKKAFHFIHKYRAKKMNPTIVELRAVLDRLLPQPQ